MPVVSAIIPKLYENPCDCLHSKFCTDCNGSVHDLFQVRALQICNGNLGQLTVTGLWKYIL